MSPADCVCITVGVTAHRHICPQGIPALRRQISEFLLKLREDYPHLPIKLLNPLAEGGDRLVAEVAIELGMSLIIPLPMPIAEYEKDFTSEESLQQFRQMCAESELIEMPLLEGNSLQIIAEDSAARARQYAQLGVFISSHAQILLALWDGKPGDGIGGTASVVHFRLHDDMPGYLEPEDTSHLLADHENDLVYHIACPQLDSSEAPEPVGWLSQQGELCSESMPANYRYAFENLQTFSQDAIRHRVALKQSVATSNSRGDPELDTIEQMFTWADWLAVHYRKRVLIGFRATHSVAALMGICFILFSEYSGLFFLLPVFLCLFFSAYILTRLTTARQWHRKYLDYRALAEGLRVQLYWTMAGVEGLSSTALAYDNILQKQDIELVWIRHIMRNALVLHQLPTVQTDERLEQAIEEWVGVEDGSSGQWEYYLRTAKIREGQMRRTSRIGATCLWLGIATAMALALIGRPASDDLYTLLLLLMGVLPLIAGVREAYAFKKADRELVKQYRFMAQLFGRARKKLSSTEDPASKRKLLRALGEACLEEHAEWLLMHRERPMEHPGLQT